MTINKNRGFGLVSVLLGLLLVGGILAALMPRYTLHQEQARAKLAGNHLAQYVDGLHRYVARDMPDPVNNPDDRIEDGLTLIGTLPMQTADCGGDYDLPMLPCIVRDRNVFDVQYTAEFSVTDAPRSIEVTVQIEPLIWKGEERHDLTALMIETANLKNITGHNGIFATIVYDPEMLEGLVTINTSSTTDPWLRVDGQNAMSADIDMDGNGLQNLSGIVGDELPSGKRQFTVTESEMVIDDAGYLRMKAPESGAVTEPAEANIYPVTFDQYGNKSDWLFITSMPAGTRTGTTQHLYREHYIQDNCTGTSSDDDALCNVERGIVLRSDEYYVPGVDRYASQAIYDATMVRPGNECDSSSAAGDTSPIGGLCGNTVQKPKCPRGMAPQVYVSVSSWMPDDSRGMFGFNSYATDGDLNSGVWEIHFEFMDSNGDKYSTQDPTWLTQNAKTGFTTINDPSVTENIRLSVMKKCV